MLPCICSVIDHRGGQNVVRTSVTHLAGHEKKHLARNDSIYKPISM